MAYFQSSVHFFEGSLDCPLMITRTFRDWDAVPDECVSHRTLSYRTVPAIEYVQQVRHVRQRRHSTPCPPSLKPLPVLALEWKPDSPSAPALTSGVVSNVSETEIGPNGRPSHFASTVYKSPYGKTYRFNSYY